MITPGVPHITTGLVGRKKLELGFALKPKPCERHLVLDTFGIVSPLDGQDEIRREDSLLVSPVALPGEGMSQPEQ